MPRRPVWPSPRVLLVGGLILVAAGLALFWYEWHATNERETAARQYGQLTFEGLRNPVGGIFVSVKRIEFSARGSGILNAEANGADPKSFGEGLVKPLLDPNDTISVVISPSVTSLDCSSSTAFPEKITIELHTQGFDVDRVGDASESGESLYRQLCLPGPKEAWAWNLVPKSPGVHLLTFRIVPTARRSDTSIDAGDIQMITVVPAPVPLIPLAQLIITSGIASILLSPLKRLLENQKTDSPPAPAK